MTFIEHTNNTEKQPQMSISNVNAHETLDLLPIIMTNTYSKKETMKHLINVLKTNNTCDKKTRN
jgi:hypothetical protein